MKIGILTLPLHTNYGGILQAYALQTVLKGMGHEVLLIDSGIHKLSKYRIIARFLKHSILSFGKTRIQHIYGFRIRRFVKQNFEILSENSVFDGKTFDAIIVGSDQVWRKDYTENIEYYFLDFAKDWKIKRIVYAASFGIDVWNYPSEKTNLCKQLASYFDYISVREESGIELCKKYLGVDAYMMVDPTLLLAANEYKVIASKNKYKVTSQLLAYVLDATDEKNEILSYLVEQKRLEYYLLNQPSFFCMQYPSIEYWLDAFSNAQYVFTDSFHGCVFSIIFNIPFIAYGNKERGITRFYSLLKMFGLEKRLICSLDELPKAMDSPINWEYVNECIRTRQELAIKTLEECLKN